MPAVVSGVVRRLWSNGMILLEGCLCRFVAHVVLPLVSVICISCVEIQTNTTLQNYWVVAS